MDEIGEAMKKPNRIMQTDDILLRAWTPDDAQWYVESRDEEVFRWTTERCDLTINDASEAILQTNNKEDVLSFAITEKNNDRLIGNIALVLDKSDRRCGEIMFWLAPWGRGRGLAGKAVELLCRRTFEDLNLEKITAKILPENNRSRRLLKRLGFQPLQLPARQEQDDNYQWLVLINQKK